MSENRRERFFDGFGIIITVMLAGLGAMLTLQIYTMTQVSDMDRRLTRIETVMVMQKIMPNDLVADSKYDSGIYDIR